MTEMYFWVKISAFFFTSFLITLIYGMSKRVLKIIYLSLILFFTGICSGAFAVYLFISKSYNNIKEIARSRTGEEIYIELFGHPEFGCVEIVHYQDQVLPRIDDGIRLFYKTCPEEVKRVLATEPFDKKTEKNPGAPVFANWPALPGDSLLVFSSASPDGRRFRCFYLSPDSTHVYYTDLLD